MKILAGSVALTGSTEITTSFDLNVLTSDDVYVIGGTYDLKMTLGTALPSVGVNWNKPGSLL
jgi:hypothetical protein